MKRIFLLTALVATAAAHAQVTLMQALEGDDAAARMRAAEAAEADQARMIPRIAEFLNDPDSGRANAAMVALERIAADGTQDARDRFAVSQALTGTLHTVAEPAWLCYLLSFAGGEEAVISLSELLNTRPEHQSDFVLALEAIVSRNTLNEATAFKLYQQIDLRLASAGLIDRIGLWGLGSSAGGERALAMLSTRLEALRGVEGPDAAAERAALYDAVVAAGARLAEREALPGGYLDLYLKSLERLPDEDAADGYRALLEATEEPRYRCAAIVGLARTSGSTADARLLMAQLDHERADVAGAAQAALQTFRNDRLTGMLAREARGAEPLTLIAILEIVQARDAGQAADLIEDAREHDSPLVRMAAMQLADTPPGPDHADTLLAVARGEFPLYREGAVEAYIDVAERVWEGGDRMRALAMLHTAVEVAESSVQQRRAVEHLAEIADPGSLPILARVKNERALREPYERAVLAIADGLRDFDRDQAKEWYAEVLDATDNRDRANHAWQALRRLGATGHPAADRGFVTRYWLIGPMPGPGLATAWMPEETYLDDASWQNEEPFHRGEQAFAATQGRTVRWQPHQVEDAFGVVDLRETIGDEMDVVAYALAEVWVDTEREIQLNIGSDDGIAVWLNGELVHRHDAARPLKIDEDSQTVTLRPGRNEIFCKIGQGTREWGFALRLTDADGAPISFAQEPPAAQETGAPS